MTAYTTASPPNLFADTWPRQILFAWLPAIGSCYAMKMQYSMFAAATVAAGLYNAEDWPPMMGKLVEVSTVRDMWGKFWHQLIRRVCTSNLPEAQFLADRVTEFKHSLQDFEILRANKKRHIDFALSSNLPGVHRFGLIASLGSSQFTLE